MAGVKRAQPGRKKSSRACREIPHEGAVKRRNERVDVPAIFHPPITARGEDPIEGTGDHFRPPEFGRFSPRFAFSFVARRLRNSRDYIFRGPVMQFTAMLALHSGIRETGGNSDITSAGRSGK